MAQELTREQLAVQQALANNTSFLGFVDEDENQNPADPEEGSKDPESLEEIVADPPAPTPEGLLAEQTPAPHQAEPIERVVIKDREFADQDSKALYDMLADGKKEDVLKYLTEALKDYSSMSNEDRMREVLKSQYPGLTSDEIEDELIEQYHLYPEEHEDYDEKLAKKGKRELKKAGDDALEKLNAAKKRIELPKIETVLTEQPQSTTRNFEEEKQVVAERNAKWLELVESEVKAIPDFTFKFNDDEGVTYKPDPSEISATQNDVKNFEWTQFAKSREWMSGDINDPESIKQHPANLARDLFILKNYNKLMSSAYFKGKSEGRVKEIKNIKNINLDTSPKPIDQGGNPEQEFYRAILANKSAKF